MQKILDFFGFKKNSNVDNQITSLLTKQESDLLNNLLSTNGEVNGAVYSLRMCWQHRKVKMNEDEWKLMIRLTNLFGNKDWSPSLDNHPFPDDEYAQANSIVAEAKKHLHK